MASLKSFLFYLVLLSFSCASAAAQTCGINDRFGDVENFATCNELSGELSDGAFCSSLHSNYISSSNQIVEQAFRHFNLDDSPIFIASASYPEGKAMVGSLALVTFRRDDGTWTTYTSPITSDFTDQLEGGNYSFLSDVASLIELDDKMMSFRAFRMPSNQTFCGRLTSVQSPS